MTDVLLALVACDTLRGQFPAGVPRRGCVRRQLELGHLTCNGCELGRQVFAEVEAAGVELRTCAKHGAAIIGEDGCEACREAVPLAARGVRPLVALSRAPSSTLLWSGEVPDMPIAPPPRQDVGLTAEDAAAAAARVRGALARPTVVPTPPRESDGPQDAAPVAPTHAAPPPAPPAEEKSMPTGIRATPCPGCGTQGSKHRQVNGKDCPERGRKAPPKPPPPVRGARPARKLVVLRRSGAPAPRAADVDELLERREALVTELEQVDKAIAGALVVEETRIARIRAAVQQATQRAAGGA